MMPDLADLFRDIAERTILQGMNDLGAVAQSDSKDVAVKLAANGDLVGVRIEAAAAPGVDVKKLSADIVQAWRRAARQMFLEQQHKTATELGFEPPSSYYDAIDERFRDRPLPPSLRTRGVS